MLLVEDVASVFTTKWAEGVTNDVLTDQAVVEGDTTFCSFRRIILTILICRKNIDLLSGNNSMFGNMILRRARLILNLQSSIILLKLTHFLIRVLNISCLLLFPNAFIQIIINLVDNIRIIHTYLMTHVLRFLL